VILGCGLDLMDVGRLEREVARRGGSLLGELFSPRELALCQSRRRPAEGYAMGYAAKEALFKALGTGKIGRMAWHDVEVSWEKTGSRAAMVLAGETARTASSMGVTAVRLALAATREQAVAWVITLGVPDAR
jgi:holo-[acyl-carrier protein] synthase